jgi:hypothetical protein
MKNFFKRDNIATFVTALTADQKINLRKTLMRGLDPDITEREINESIYLGDGVSDDSSLIDIIKNCVGPKKIEY